MSAPTTTVRYRLARAADAAAIAALHAESWRTAYRGMFSDDYLDNDVFADRDAVWKERFSRTDDSIATVTIMAEMAGELVGFAHSFVDEDKTYGTLLDNLHVRPDAKRLGIGTRLMAETAAWLEWAGSGPGLYLWVLQGNISARRFYEAAGGQPSGEGVSKTGGSSAPSLRLWWPELGRLSRLLPEGLPPIANEDADRGGNR